MDTKVDLKVKSVSQKYEVFGHGPMPTATRQIGEWLVTPYTDWEGTLPLEAQQALMEFLRQGIPFVGLVIADDVREIEYKKQLTVKEEKNEIITLPKAEIKPTSRDVLRRREDLVVRMNQISPRVNLPVKPEPKVQTIERPQPPTPTRSENVPNGLANGLRAVGNGLATGLRVAGTIAAGVVLLPVAAIAAILFDPVLVAVLPDGTWLEIFAWWDE